jgi:hypothetical protein
VVSLLFALIVSTALVPAAQAEGLHRTAIGIHCVATAVELTETHQSCEAVVEDGSPEPTPPTGLMTLNHSITCTLAPVLPNGSACDFSVATPPGDDYTLTGNYSGDASHASSEFLLQWQVGVEWLGQEVRVFPYFVPLSEPVTTPKSESAPAGTSPAVADATPPAATAARPRIAARPARRTRRRLARFRFEGDADFECELDSGPYSPCGAAYRHPVAIGAHALRVRPAGGGPVASFHWRVLPRR